MKYFIFSLFLITNCYALNSSTYLSGKKIYETACISCHGEDGNADVDLKFVVKPRSLRSSILNMEQNYQIIKYGARHWGASSDMMPAFVSVYDEKKLQAISYYIQTKFNPNSEQRVEELYEKSDKFSKEQYPKMMKLGEKIYKRNCCWCHGPNAKGDGKATRNPKKTFYPYNLNKTLLTDKQMFLYAKYGGKYWGTSKTDMPSWKRKYDDFALKSVILYIEETFN